MRDGSVLLWLMNGHINIAKISGGSASTLHELDVCCWTFFITVFVNYVNNNNNYIKPHTRRKLLYCLCCQ